MAVQINTDDLKKRYVELEFEKAAIATLLHIHDVTIPDLKSFLFNPDAKPEVPALPLPTIESKPIKRTYKKRTPSHQHVSREVKIDGEEWTADTLKGLRAIGAFIGVTEGNVWALMKSHDLPVRKYGMFKIASKLELRHWCLKHPKYHVTEESTSLTKPVRHETTLSGSERPASVSGEMKTIKKFCENPKCKRAFTRVVAADFNEAAIKYCSPACAREAHVLHSAG